MKHVFSYCELRAFKGSQDKFTVFGLHIPTLELAKHTASLVYRDHAATLKIATASRSVVCLPDQRFLTTTLPYPIQHVPMANMFWIKACDLAQGMKIAVTPKGLVRPANIYSPQTVGHTVCWDIVSRISATDILEHYGVAVDDCSTYTVNEMLLKSYDCA